MDIDMNSLTLFFASLLIAVFGIAFFGGPLQAPAQDSGDQILDGIGETDMIARYVFSGNLKDASRNNQHATLHGTKGAFVEDEQFGSVLSLPGKSGGHVEIPSKMLTGVETISVTAWVHLGSATPGQRLFDFGQDKTTSFSVAPTDPNTEKSYRVCIAAPAAASGLGKSVEQGPTALRINTGQWVHLAVVLDAAGQTLSSYADGVRVGHTTGVKLNLKQIIDQENTDANHLYIGKSHFSTDPNLDSKVHDFRIYSIALTGKQVATIHRNAIPGGDASEPEDPAENQPTTDGSLAEDIITQPEALGLIEVPDISAEAVVGHLPRLPYMIDGIYRDGAKGPQVRVIWPSPNSNDQVLKTGVYTLVGQVVGTDFKPKAVVTVKQATSLPTAPSRKLVAFPLGQVALNLDNRQQPTPFMKNRDKFILTLAETDPDRFLYMFRDAFGQPQPEGTRPLGVWDSQTTKLRGHASGHYLSAIAQAYASTTYDEKLRANFKGKMDYLIGTLYDLSQRWASQRRKVEPPMRIQHWSPTGWTRPITIPI
jgi:hypothetical protein